ncbi:MAG: C_GCAxxG_C_C family protein [Clostridiales bacterium]|jgi:C_GCAxxG_C_C family probable redox protein|nr:C_GCAxxG_C_C family protein [Clostridiales bacterium]
MICEKLHAILSGKLFAFENGGLNCAETVLSTMCEYWNMDAPFAPKIATAFGGGLAATRGVCGAVTGGLMAIGLKLGREVGGDRAPAYDLAREFMEWVEREYGSRDCSDLIGMKRGEPGDSRNHADANKTVCQPLIQSVCEYLAERL